MIAWCLSCQPRRRAMAALAVVTTVAVATAVAEPLVERTVMPDAAPSSFAVGFPDGVSFCYDPVRGGLNYAWHGGFADFTPARPGLGKFIKPVKLLGDVVYREQGPAPLRRGDPGRVPAIVFKGYRLQEEAVEFLYTVDGVLVREEVRPRPAGDGLVRRFRIEPANSNTQWWYVPGPTEGARLSSPTGQLNGNSYCFATDATPEFTLEIVFLRKQS